MAKILILDDDETCILVTGSILKQVGHEVYKLTRPGLVLQEIRKISPDLLITDLMMPGATGGIVYDAVRKEIGPDLPIIVSSGTTMKVNKPDPLLADVPKPVDPAFLRETVMRLLAAAAGETPEVSGVAAPDEDLDEDLD
jgi:CheY-like chemotaxis protein